MNSRREEERNEKIIRGLMKLPPNRRCINCNSLGPQYVCTTFWTFVCTTCSGIHREFTHRVKSVSMAKFTSQEVDALQKGGNQRARELFLRAWDPQRNRLPDNSNFDKLRQFIKHVYIEKMYSLEKSSDRPPRDPQSVRNHEDETRRASSYHSYSQSPPYDFQYEERRYGKPAPGLTRRVGSDHGLYDGKFAGVLSPTHLSDDGFASEGSFSRASDFSASGGGDAFRSGFFSPSPNRDTGSPFSDTSREMSSKVPHSHAIRNDPDTKGRSSEGRMFRQQRSVSSGSFGSFDSNSTFQSVNSESVPAGDTLHKSSSLPSLPQSSVSPQNVTSTPSGSTFPEKQPSQMPQHPPLDLFAAPSHTQSKIPPSSEIPQSPSLDLFAAPLEQQSKSPQNSQMSQSPPVDLFNTSQPHSEIQQTSHTPPSLSVDFFAVSQQQSTVPQPSLLDFFASPQQQMEIPQSSQRTEPPPVDLFAAPQQQSEISQPTSFDLFAAPQQQASVKQSSQTPQLSPLDSFAAFPQQQLVAIPNGKASDGVLPGNGGWATFDMLQNMGIDTKNSVPVTVPPAEGNPSGNFNPFSDYQSSYQDPSGHEPSVAHAFGPDNLQTSEFSISNTDIWSAFDNSARGQINPEVLNRDEQAALHHTSDANKSLGFGGYEVATSLTNLAGVQSLANDHKPINPFELPYDSGMESSNMSQFWDMSSLQATLPNTQMSASDVDGVNESWFPQNPVPSYVSGGVPFDPTSGSLGFMTGKTPSTQIPNIHHSQGPLAASSSVGGNPFA